jgi:L-fuconolactonase
MPAGPLIDSHVHFWDPRRIRYPWLDSVPRLNAVAGLEAFQEASGKCGVEAVIFVECDAVPKDGEQEVQWVSELAKSYPRIRGIVARAPLEQGREVCRKLERLHRYPLVRGTRRVLQSESDPEFCLRPAFIEGVRALREFNFSFDLCVNRHQLSAVATFAAQVPDVTLILNHIGKPDITAGELHPWMEHLRLLAQCPNVLCKISGVATEANHLTWHPAHLKPYIEAAIDAFGFDRVMFGSDWPVSTQAIEYRRWIEVLDETLVEATEAQRRQFWQGNARKCYRL